jgi:hypothetical protein
LKKWPNKSKFYSFYSNFCNSQSNKAEILILKVFQKRRECGIFDRFRVKKGTYEKHQWLTKDYNPDPLIMKSDVLTVASGFKLILGHSHSVLSQNEKKTRKLTPKNQYVL